MSKLKGFYLDAEMRRQVYDHITATARERLVEDAMREADTKWYNRLMFVLQDSDRALSDMFEVKEDKPKVNPAK